MDSNSDDNEELDPRVQGELESLNQATDEINKYETEISDERSNFKILLSDATSELEAVGKKFEKSIARARPYYAALKDANQARAALQRAAHNFQRANGVYRAAKETINLAEQRLSEFSDYKVDAAWQEVLNLQTNRFMEADADRKRSELLHQQATTRFEFYEKKCQKIKNKHKNSTEKTKSYFEKKESLEKFLQEQQKKVINIQVHIDAAKAKYKQSLLNLANISSEIHEKRQASNRMMALLNNHETKMEKDSREEDLPITSHEFDLTGPNLYDDIEDLENDLNNFVMTEIESDDESLSGTDDDEETISSSTDNFDMTSSHNDKIGRRHSSKKIQDGRRQMTIKKRLSPLGIADDIADNVNNEVFFLNKGNKPSNKSFEFTQENRNATYNCLHGTNSSHTDDYDIFEDLC